MMDELLTPNEVEALMSSMSPSKAAKEAKQIDLIARDHHAFALLSELQSGADRWATQAGWMMTRLFRGACDVSAEPVEVVPAGRVDDLVGPSRFRFPLGEDAGQAVLDDVIGLAFVARQFGGEIEQGYPAERPATATELRTVRRLASPLVELLRRALAPICDLEGATIRNRSSRTGGESGSAMVLFGLRIEVGDQVGLVSVSLSTARMRFKLDRAAAKPRRDNPVMRGELARVGVTVSSILGSCSLRVSELMALKPGDVLLLDTAVDGEIDLLIEGGRKFTGTPMLNRGSLSLKIAERCKE